MGAGGLQPGTAITARQSWKGYLWEADPCIVVEDAGDSLIEWRPSGAVSCYASSRYYPGREHLPRNERQLVSMATCKWKYRNLAAPVSGLNFVAPGEWVRISLVWSPAGEFLHWYVNFQRPIERESWGYETMDLVLDVVVSPEGEWRWKDRDDFHSAIDQGILDVALEPILLAAADRVITRLEAREGPFDPQWRRWTPPPAWSTPILPSDFAAGLAFPDGAWPPEDAA